MRYTLRHSLLVALCMLLLTACQELPRYLWGSVPWRVWASVS